MLDNHLIGVSVEIKNSLPSGWSVTSELAKCNIQNHTLKDYTTSYYRNALGTGKS
jgi:hypothetical protein